MCLPAASDLQPTAHNHTRAYFKIWLHSQSNRTRTRREKWREQPVAQNSKQELDHVHDGQLRLQ